jgi:hypothetical protein
MIIKSGKLYRHFKGGIYKVVCVGYHSETNEKMVVYKDIESNKVCIRPYDMFTSDVDKEKYPNVKQKKRFERIKKSRKLTKKFRDHSCSDFDISENSNKKFYESGIQDGKNLLK